MQLDSIPILLSGARAIHLTRHETHIMDLARTIIESGDESLRVHVDAITIAGELAALHETSSQTAEAARIAANQLKLHHLDLLDRYFDCVSAHL